jgi:antitoxin VapB
MQKAVVTTQGAFQSVHLPEGFHVKGKEVFIKRLGKTVLLIPEDANPWDLMEESLLHFTDDFMQERAQPASQQREELKA